MRRLAQVADFQHRSRALNRNVRGVAATPRSLIGFILSKAQKPPRQGGFVAYMSGNGSEN